MEDVIIMRALEPEVADIVWRSVEPLLPTPTAQQDPNPVLEARQIWGREHHAPAGTEHAGNLCEEAIGVDEVFDDLPGELPRRVTHPRVGVGPLGLDSGEMTGRHSSQRTEPLDAHN